jgi:hypothetical protein
VLRSLVGRGAGEAIPCNIATLEYSQGHLHKVKAYTVNFLKEMRDKLKHMFPRILTMAFLW